MISYNKFTGAGYITRDPEMKTLPSGSVVTNFTLAINKEIRSNGTVKKKTLFINVTCWEAIARNVAKYCFKGSPVLVEGELETNEWNDPTTGLRREKWLVNFARVVFLSAGPSATTGSAPAQSTADAPAAEAPVFRPTAAAAAPAGSSVDEDVPF